MNHVERIRRKWAQGELCVGTVVALTDATVSELFGEAGYDFVWLDCEHSAMSLSDVLNHVRALGGVLGNFADPESDGEAAPPKDEAAKQTPEPVLPVVDSPNTAVDSSSSYYSDSDPQGD